MEKSDSVAFPVAPATAYRDPHPFCHELCFSSFHLSRLKVWAPASKMSRGINWPKPVDLGDLSPEERANIAIEMSSVVGEIMMDSIRDRHLGISEARHLRLARKRILKGRRGR